MKWWITTIRLPWSLENTSQICIASHRSQFEINSQRSKCPLLWPGQLLTADVFKSWDKLWGRIVTSPSHPTPRILLHQLIPYPTTTTNVSTNPKLPSIIVFLSLARQKPALGKLQFVLVGEWSVRTRAGTAHTLCLPRSWCPFLSALLIQSESSGYYIDFLTPNLKRGIKRHSEIF